MSKTIGRRLSRRLAIMAAGGFSGAMAITGAYDASGGETNGHEHHAAHAAPQSLAVHVPQQAEPHDQPNDHERHVQTLAHPGHVRSEAGYHVPDVVLTNQDGERVKLRELLAGPQAVMLNYIYTSCTTICPVLSASFAQTQKALGEEARDIRMVSISIDPEYDTPARLRDYAQRFEAGEGWELLTGSLEDIVTVQKAFDAYRGNKSSHIPLTFIRAGAGDRWIRLQGFASAGELVQEYRSLASSLVSSAAGAGRG